ncbi:MAG: DinB family protein [Gemmataceae bacterium]
MFERELKIYALMLDYLQRLVADLDDEQIAKQPSPGINTPLWILGHLAISTDFAAQMLGGGSRCPKEWIEQYGPKSKPVSDQQPRPTKAELVAAIEAGHHMVTELAKSANEEAMRQPHPLQIGVLQDFCPTVGDLVSHLLTSHPGIHSGQLSAWRRQMGLPPA